MRRLISWTWRTAAARLLHMGGRTALDAVLRTGGRTAVGTALGAAAEAFPLTAPQSYTQVFNVRPPITVYVRASHCRVTVRREDAPKVILQANMVRSFGLEFATDQDEAGVYIVAKRKTVTGKLSRADFTITIPPQSHLICNLTPGDVVVQNIDGMIELPESGAS